MTSRLKSASVMLSTCLFVGQVVLAQTQPQPSPPPAAPPPQLPVPAQFKKTVVFIRTNCVRMPAADEMAAMSPVERGKWSEESLSKMKPEELALLPQDSYVGTGFVVDFPDERLGKDREFLYLVTNRHVAQPGIENGSPCRVTSYSFSVNHTGPTPGASPFLMSLPAGPGTPWVYPEDNSVDLAAMGFALPMGQFDYKTIPLSMFVTEDMVQKGEVVEGDPVMFCGLFIQYTGANRLEPVVRSGSIAMIPSDPVQTTLHRQGRLYFAEAHAFGGNSGSPAFVDVNRFKGALGFDYRFLGVVAGEVLESADLSLQVMTSYNAKIAANSGVSVVVPAFEVKKLLQSSQFQSARDQAVKQLSQQRPGK